MNKNLSMLSSDKGVMAIIVALMLAVFLGIAALAIDVGYKYVAQNQLQNAADAAALAGARYLGYIYKNKINGANVNGTLSDDNISLIKNAAKETAYANKAAGVNITIVNTDISIGIWNSSNTPPLTPTNDASRAVQVNVHRDTNNVSGAIATFFGRILGKNTMNVSAIATAAISPVSVGGQSPFGISGEWFGNGCPTTTLTWSGDNKDGKSCAAWEGNKGTVLPIMNCISAGNCTSTKIGDPLDIKNGEIANLFDDLLNLFDQMKKVDGDGDNNKWTTQVAVASFDCGNGGSALIRGYATISITDVLIPDPKNPKKTIRAISLNTDCQVVKDQRGGGSINGTDLASIPSLVQ